MDTFISLLDTHAQQNLTAYRPEWQSAFAQLLTQKAQAVWVLRDGEHAYAWLSLWWEKTPSYKHFKTACIGTYYAADSHQASTLLTHAEQQLREKGIEYIIAPMDGNTWHAYRLTTQLYDEQAFFLDRMTPLEWNQHFSDAGFSNIASYASTCSNQLIYADETAQQWQKKLQSDGAYSLRPFNLNHVQEQLQDIYTLSLQSFKHNFLYTDIALDEFIALYEPILPYVVPYLIQMVYKHDELVAFAFAVPNYAQRTKERPNNGIDSVIFKTIARHPSPEFKGLGAFLVWNMHQITKHQGYEKLITAFMHEDNVSLHLSLKSGHIIREYALYGKQL